MLRTLLRSGLVLMLAAAPVAAQEPVDGTAGASPGAALAEPSGPLLRRALQSGLAVAVLVVLTRRGGRRDAARPTRRARPAAPASSMSW